MGDAFCYGHSPWYAAYPNTCRSDDHENKSATSGALGRLYRGKRKRPSHRLRTFFADADPSPMLNTIPELVYSDKRIRQPMVRRSWLTSRENSDRTLRGREDFVAVDWDTALDLVAEENRRIRERYGASGIFNGSYGWSSAGRVNHARTLVRRFYFQGGGGVDQQGNYSWGAAQFFLPYVMGTYMPLTGRVTDWPQVVEHAEIFVAFGGLALKNAQVASGGAGQHSLKPALEQLAAKGTPVINISPMRDDCPEFVRADWIPIRPNTDVALMLALGYEIYQRGATDEDFLARHCTGWPQLRAYLLGESDGIAKTAGWASRITAVPAERIVQLAQQLIGKRSFITCSYSVQRAHRGEQPYWMMIALSSMLGQPGLPGAGFSFGHGSMNSVGNPRQEGPAPMMSTGPNPSGLSIPVARISDMLLNPGQPYSFQGETLHYPDIHMVHWAGGNPFHHHQQLNRLVEGWQKPDTVVVQDIVWTPAAQMADIVLPATTTLERNDIGARRAIALCWRCIRRLNPSIRHVTTLISLRIWPSDWAIGIPSRKGATRCSGSRIFTNNAPSPMVVAALLSPNLRRSGSAASLKSPKAVNPTSLWRTSAPIPSRIRSRPPAAKLSCSARPLRIISWRIWPVTRNGVSRGNGWERRQVRTIHCI